VNVICCLFHVKNFLLAFFVQATFATSHVAAHCVWAFLGQITKQLILGILGTKTKPSKTILGLQLLPDGA